MSVTLGQLLDMMSRLSDPSDKCAHLLCMKYFDESAADPFTFPLR